MTWKAEVFLSTTPDGVHNLEARVDGETNKAALAGAKMIFDAFTANRETFVQAAPEAVSETDFDTKIMRHRGYVRCAFLDKQGPIHRRAETIYPVFVGFGGGKP